MHLTPRDSGWIEVICGSMFSGKTEELIRRLKRAQIAKQKVQVFKPRIDRRYDEEQIVSHSLQKLVSVPVDGADELLAKVDRSTCPGAPLPPREAPATANSTPAAPPAIVTIPLGMQPIQHADVRDG